MAYTTETIRKVTRSLNDAIAHYDQIAVGEIPMCISDGNKKIGRVMNVSLPPIISCGNCSECQKLCYDIKACNQYPNTVIDARARNFSILKRNREGYFERIRRAIARRRKNLYFRWHVAGDIMDADYLDHMNWIAEQFPEFIFWAYTKMYGIVNDYCGDRGREMIADNLSIMFSEWRGMPMENPHGFPEFRVVFKDEVEPVGFYCPGNCDVCKKVNRGCIVGETTYCREH